MCVRWFIILLIVCVVIISRNQACSHCTSKSLASANPKSALNFKSTSGKDLGMSYHKKYSDNPKYWTGSKSPSTKFNKYKPVLDSNGGLSYEQDDSREMRRENVQARKRSSSERGGYGSDSFVGMKQQQKSRSGVAPVGIGVDKIRSYLEEQQRNRLEPLSIEVNSEKSSSYVGADRERSRSSPEKSRSFVGADHEKSKSLSEPVQVGQKKGRYGGDVVGQMRNRVGTNKDKSFKITFADSGEDQFLAKNNQNRENFEHDLGQEKYRISEGWNENDEKMLQEIDERRLQTLGKRERDNYRAPYSEERVGEPFTQTDSRHKQLDADHIKEFNYKKSKALESFEGEESFEDNMLGAATKKSTDGPMDDAEDYFTDSEAEQIIDILEYDSSNEKTSDSHTEKSKGEIMGGYREVLRKVQELYKILNAPVASGAERLDDPELYTAWSGNDAKLPSSPDQVKTQSSQGAVSKRPPYNSGDKRPDDYDDFEPDENYNRPKKVGNEYRKLGAEADSRSPDGYRKSRPYAESDRRNTEMDAELSYGKSYDRRPEVGRESPIRESSKRKPEAEEFSGNGRTKPEVGSKYKYIEYSRRGPEVRQGTSRTDSAKHRTEAARSDFEEKNPKRRPEVDSDCGYQGYSRQRSRGPVEDGYTGGSRRNPEVSPEYARRTPESNVEYPRQRGEENSGYSKPRSEYNSRRRPEYEPASEKTEYSARRPGVSTRKGYSDWDYPEYSSREYQEQRNLASLQCKFENLDPSRETISSEEDRNLQFRSFQRKSGNNARADDLGAAEDHNINKYADDDNVNEQHRNQNTAEEESLKPALSPYRGHQNEDSGVIPRVGNSKQSQNSLGSNLTPNVESDITENSPSRKSSFGAKINIFSEPVGTGSPTSRSRVTTEKPSVSSNLHDDLYFPDAEDTLGVMTGNTLSKTETTSKSKAIVTPEQFQDSKSSKKETEESETGVSDKAGCGDLFRCLAEMGQTLITPEKETKATQQVAIAEHVPQTTPKVSASNGAPSSHGFARDAATGLDNNVGVTGSPNVGKGFGSNYVEDHPFYGLVTRIIDAAQEATKQRLLEEKRAKLTYHPERTQQAQPAVAATGSGKKPETPTVAQIPTTVQRTGLGAKISSAADSGKAIAKQSPSTGIAKAVAKQSPSTGSGKAVAKPNPLTGSEKKVASEKQITGNGKNTAGNPTLSKLGAARSELWNKLKAAVPQKSGSAVLGKKLGKPEITGKARTTGSARPSTDQKSSSKGSSNGDKVGVVRNVTFIPVSLKAPETPAATSQDANPKVEQKNNPSAKVGSQKNDPKTAGTKLKSQAPGSKLQNLGSSTSSSSSSSSKKSSASRTSG